MATMSPRTWKATAAGIINIVGGALNGLMALGLIIALLVVGSINLADFMTAEEAAFIAPFIVPIMVAVLVTAIIAAVFPIIGGVFALRRKGWGWALAGSIILIIAMFGRPVLGILSTIFVSMAKDEFD
jgi:hypothetical protein